MPTKEELGRRLRMARFEKGLTLKEVAARCGMSATHISEVERGKTSPTIGALQRIAEALEENPAHFVRDESFPRVSFVHGPDTSCIYLKNPDDELSKYSVLSKGLPDGMMQLFERRMPPNTKVKTNPRIGEIFIICMAGMVRISTDSESVVLREGDTIQLRMDHGFEMEVLGDEEHHGLAAFAAPVLIPT